MKKNLVQESIELKKYVAPKSREIIIEASSIYAGSPFGDTDPDLQEPED